jgi:hypothetical protein
VQPVLARLGEKPILPADQRLASLDAGPMRILASVAVPAQFWFPATSSRPAADPMAN